ncbi:GNAT family N-acetyltransferase [Archangium violaceum]|uniref:GNAT family N-acetyltransferase n=1 Tax=Archangium violaceum TaxID=83451 RepID=UPI00193B1088|nr:GNAT family protein [Archangium violaceum]QRK07364.1 GNAT family N-acetyltransferase [Archangium violaceum]
MKSLRSERLLLRPPRPEDLAPLSAILSDPAVSRWWPGFDESKVESELIAPDPDVTVYVIEHEHGVIGAIQFSEELDPQYRHASIDLFLSPRAWGRGFAPEAIRTLAVYLFEERGHHRLVIDPAADNARAIRAYEKVGFRPVGTMRQYERGADGTWHDGVLLDLLADELAPPTHPPRARA